MALFCPGGWEWSSPTTHLDEHAITGTMVGLMAGLYPSHYRVKARCVFSPQGDPVFDAVLNIGNGVITAVNSHDTGTVDVDWGNAAIIPPLVNAHTHLEFSHLVEPLPPPDGQFVEWLRLVMHQRSVRAEVDPKAWRSVAAGLEKSRAAGCLTVGDIVTSVDPPTPYQAESWEGVRFLEMTGVSMPRVAQQLHRAQDYLASLPEQGRMKTGLSPHAPYSVSMELVQRSVELARRHHIPIAMHLAESTEEVQLLHDRGGPLATMLTDLGIWPPAHLTVGMAAMDYLRVLAAAPQTLIIHGNYLSPEELAFLATNRDRMTLIYCPRTHHLFKHAAWPLRIALDLGVRVALGTDSCASNPDLSIWKEAQFIAAADPEFSPVELLRMITQSGEEALGRAGHCLAVGSPASFCVVRLPDHNTALPYDLLFDPESCPIAAWSHGQSVNL